jgi:hypothetical protein
MFYHYIIDILSTLGRDGLEVLENAEVLTLGFSKAVNLRLASAGYDQNDGLDQFRIGFCVRDRGGCPSLIVSLRVQNQVLQGIH